MYLENKATAFYHRLW